ncbi:PREDICTED: granulins-like, partial [Gekko japonicus]|uniref:Granulins-like n=1 Tax=Gekko japonicus TaxID=146911 RepID=A0ABM1K7F7_GEKJA
AVCCPDHLHCCPSGFRCGPSAGTCVKDGESIPWLEKRPAIVRITSSSRDVRCDDQVSCPDGQTCCQLASGAWGCCPLPQAVCCPDHLHCCPSGFRCGPSAGTCVKDGESIPWLEKRPAVVHVARSPSSPWLLVPPALARLVRCDDQTSCPDGQTCCQLSSGKWGCCPFAQAVCCADHVHCCPQGYTCDVASGSCHESLRALPWGPKLPAADPLQNRDVRCDDTTTCAEGQTCCKSKAGTWSCCQLPNAVCCADHVHCCPQGYTCDVASGSCHESLRALPWGPKLPAADPLQNRDVRCDDTTSCAEGQTCCKSKAGTWSCCQLPNAVCCADHQHCCPSGYTCNLKAQTCEKQQQPQSPTAEGVQASVSLSPPRAATSGRDVPCDAQHYCHDRQTCCQTSTGWACCPYNKGSCCSDKRHCCPFGFRCSSSGLQCLRKGPLRWDADVLSSRSKQALPLL